METSTVLVKQYFKISRKNDELLNYCSEKQSWNARNGWVLLQKGSWTAAVPVAFLLPLLQSSRGSSHITALPSHLFLETEQGQFISIIPGSNVRRGCGLLPLKHLVTSFYMCCALILLHLYKAVFDYLLLGLAPSWTILTQLLMWGSFPWPPFCLFLPVHHSSAQPAQGDYMFHFRGLDNQKALFLQKCSLKSKQTQSKQCSLQWDINTLFWNSGTLVFNFSKYILSERARNSSLLLETTWPYGSEEAAWLDKVTGGFVMLPGGGC